MELRALKLLAMAATGALLMLILHAGQPDDRSWWLFAIPFGVWIIGPALLPYVLARRIARWWFVRTMLSFHVASSLWSAYAYYRAFFVSRSSTAALVMVFVPLYQWIALGILSLASGAIGLRLRASRSRA